MATFTRIEQAEFERFLGIGNDGKPLGDTGWYRIQLPGTRELVYSRLVRPDLSQRIYSSIEPGGVSRDKGSDAIRVVLVWRQTQLHEPRIIGVERRVHRVLGWRHNLQTRLLDWQSQFGPQCPCCAAPTVERTSKRGKFFGCCRYPECRGTAGASTVTRVATV